MDHLLNGYQRFLTDRWPRERERFEALAALGQKPRALVVACSDSRVDPQMIFDAGPGELFVVRNVANLVPPYAPDAGYHGTSAALEFGVRVLKVEHIVVIGHALCGGVSALLNGVPADTPDFVGPWVSIAEPALSRVPERSPPEVRQQAAEWEGVRVSLGNLRSFPWVREAEEAGRLELHGAWFDIRSGALMRLGEDGTFSAWRAPRARSGSAAAE